MTAHGRLAPEQSDPAERREGQNGWPEAVLVGRAEIPEHAALERRQGVLAHLGEVGRQIEIIGSQVCVHRVTKEDLNRPAGLEVEQDEWAGAEEEGESGDRPGPGRGLPGFGFRVSGFRFRVGLLELRMVSFGWPGISVVSYSRDLRTGQDSQPPVA